MQVQRYHDSQAFYDAAEAFLLRDEAANNLPFGLTTNLIRNPTLYESLYAATACENGEVVGAAIRTPPFNFIIAAHSSEGAITALMQDAAKVFDTLRGLLGTKENSAFAARLWEEISGQKAQRGLLERIYKLERVIPPEVSGAMRKAVEPDRALLLRWMYWFQVDAFGADEVDTAAIERHVDEVLKHGSREFYFWENGGQPVAMAAYTGFTPNGVRIGPVYTPPEHRRNGYGSAITAAVSQMLLDRGRKFCFLFTDLKNPTSNHIYQTIGYEPVCDFDEWVFA